MHVRTCAGVRCVLVETQRPSHAKDILAALPMHELELYDGVLAVSCCILLVQSEERWCMHL